MMSDYKAPYTDQKDMFLLPCLSTSGINLFAATADQRFLATTADDFLRTHFPMHLQAHHAGITTTISENDLLQRFLQTEVTTTGNRVMILYGAAGSGKSELIRWLQLQIGMRDAARANLITRIPRTGLDIFHIVQLLRHQYRREPFQTNTQQRWEECRQKPRTLAKLLVLTALEQLLHSDEEINAVYYQLIDIVQANLEHCFAVKNQSVEEPGTIIELLRREDLDEIHATSVIPISIEYEKLRFYLLKAFSDRLLEGVDLSQLLKQIAQAVQREQGHRPILLIDDLVQSINVFATELLDYFITLEEGCWDIIVGITPSSLETTKRGKDLLDRIAFLDTIDDRVEKFWLSDEYGLSSSFLNEKNCTDYARAYLSEYKRQNSRPCDITCPAFQRCHHLEPERSDNLLAPFNQEILTRLFRSLPSNKGKVRYFTLYLRSILERMTQGEDWLIILKEFVKSELAVHHTNSRFAQIYELYGPFSETGRIDYHTFLANCQLFFESGIDIDGDEQPTITTLHRQLPSGQSSQQSLETTLSIDPGKEAIKYWLQGDTVNKQHLHRVRRGILKAIKDGYLLDTMTRLYIARPSRILRWAQTRLDTIPPLQLEDVDDFEGIEISREIGPLAYMLHDFADAVGWVEQELRTQLLNHPGLPVLFFRGAAYRQHTHSKLEQQLGMKVEELAFSLFVVVTQFNRIPIELPPLIQEKIEHQKFNIIRYPDRIEAERPHISSSHISMIRRLFDDCFKLRENVYDGLLLEKMIETIPPIRALALLQNIDLDNLAGDFRLNEEPLSTLLLTIQHQIDALAGMKEHPKTRALLITICKAGVQNDELSQQFIALLCLPGNTEQQVDRFLKRCTPLELHKALCLAYHIDLAQYEHSLFLLREALIALEKQVGHTDIVTRLYKSFLREEVDTLSLFTQQDFRISMSQVDTAFLTKVADQFPDLYRRLELRLQKG